MPTELFLADAQQLHLDLEAFASGRRRSLGQVASSAEALADLLRSLGFAHYGDCLRALARVLANPAGPAAADEARPAAGALSVRLGQVLGALQLQGTAADDLIFARDWIAGLPGMPAPAAAHAAVDVPPDQMELAPPVQPGTDPAGEHAVERHAALTQARELHRALTGCGPEERLDKLRQLQGLLQRTHVAVDAIAGRRLATPLRAAPEAVASLERAVVLLPETGKLHPFLEGSVCGLKLEAVQPPADILARAGAVLAAWGGRIDRLEAHLRLALPVEPRCIEILPLQLPEGWVAVGGLQLDGDPDGQTCSVRAGIRAGRIHSQATGVPGWGWIDPLPATPALPEGWLALASAEDGRVMPLHGPAEPA